MLLLKNNRGYAICMVSCSNADTEKKIFEIIINYTENSALIEEMHGKFISVIYLGGCLLFDS